MSKTTVDNLAVNLAATLEQWAVDGDVKLKKAVAKRAKTCKDRIVNDSPYEYGMYSKGWTAKIMFNGKREIRIRIHNKDYPGLTHLLENGHAIVDKNHKSHGRVQGFPHIRPAEQEANEGIKEDVRRIYGGTT